MINYDELDKNDKSPRSTFLIRLEYDRLEIYKNFERITIF